MIASAQTWELSDPHHLTSAPRPVPCSLLKAYFTSSDGAVWHKATLRVSLQNWPVTFSSAYFKLQTGLEKSSCSCYKRHPDCCLQQLPSYNVLNTFLVQAMNAPLLPEEYDKAQHTTAKQKPGIKLLRWINDFQCNNTWTLTLFYREGSPSETAAALLKP